MMNAATVLFGSAVRLGGLMDMLEGAKEPMNRRPGITALVLALLPYCGVGLALLGGILGFG
jgi:hypothetical protein